MLKKIFWGVLLFWSISIHVNAAAAGITVVPSAWRLENYMGGRVVAYYTGSSCAAEKLTFNSSASLEDKNRFWSLIMAAKIAKASVIVFYENASSECEILSFALKEDV